MKKLLVFIVLIAFIILPFAAACSGEAPTEVSREPIDARYTEAYEGIETHLEYTYNWLKGEFVLVPLTQTVRHEAKWEIQYRITYDNGKEKTEWCYCTEAEYNNAKAELGGTEDGK